MKKIKQKNKPEIKNYDWIVLGKHPSAILSACIASKLGAKVCIFPNLGKQDVREKNQINIDEKFNYTSNWVGGFSDTRSKAKIREQGLLELCLDNISPELILNGFFDQEETLLFTPNYRLSAQDFLSKYLVTFEKNKQTSALDFKFKIFQDYEQELIYFWNKIPALFHTEINASNNNVSKVFNLLDLFIKLKGLFSYSASLGHKLEKKWFNQRKTFQSTRLKRQLDREKVELLSARLVGASGILLSAQDLINEGTLDWPFYYSSRLRRLKTDLNAWVSDLMRIAQLHGAHVEEFGQVESIVIDSNQLSGVRFIDKKTHHSMFLSSHGVVHGGSLGQLENLIQENKHKKLVQKKKSKMSVKGWNFSWEFSACVGSWEQSMPQRIVWSELGAQPIEFEWITDFRKNDSVTRLRCRTVLPWVEKSLEILELKKLIFKLLKQAENIFPGIDFLDLNKSIHENQIEALYPWKKLEDLPDYLRLYFGSGSGIDSGVEGLFLANDSTYPSLSSFAWPVVALESSSWLAHRLGMKGPFLNFNEMNELKSGTSKSNQKVRR